MWTVETVQEQLPTVNVKFSDGSCALGLLTGRKCEFARVYVKRGQYHVSGEYAWETVTRALNAGRPLMY